MHASPLVLAKDLCFGYGERRILDGVTFEVPRGKVTALMGASGGGKTTVLRLISGQYRAQSASFCSMAKMWVPWPNPLCTWRVGAWACCFSLVLCSPI
jgi:ABC-type transporter Mla maintaining outer membrane lipid asymmetry ATPase subunit MlaF